MEQDRFSTVRWLDLCSMAASGDAAAEDLFFGRLRRRMIVLASRTLRTRDVEDLVQDVLVIVHRKYRDLLSSSGFRDHDGFDRWCRRILYHRIGNDIRRRRFESAHRLPAEHLLTIPSADVSDVLHERAERRHLFRRALGHLNAAQRAFLREVIGAPHSTGEARGTRNARYAKAYRARKALSQAIRRESSCSPGAAVNREAAAAARLANDAISAARAGPRRT